MGKEKILYNLLKRFIKDRLNYVESEYGVSKNNLYLDGSVKYKSDEEKEVIQSIINDIRKEEDKKD